MTTAYWREYWSNPARRQNPFVGTAKGQHRAEDITKVGSSFDVPALRAGIVAVISHQFEVGHWFSVDVGGGLFDIYCHMQRGSFPPVGTALRTGEIIGRMADWPKSADTTGTVWTGPHIHFVISDTPLGATRPHAAFDPRPVISATLAAPPSPTPAPQLPLEEDDMIALRINNGSSTYLAAIGPGIFRHFVATDPFEKIKNILRVQDDWQDITMSELPALLRTFGCDLNIWDVRNGQFVVLDPLSGTVAAGSAWTASGAIRAAIAAR